MATEALSWYCSTIDFPDDQSVKAYRPPGDPGVLAPMGVADANKLWPKGTTLRVRFLEGSPELRARTLKAARAWLVDGVRLDMREAAPGTPSDLRIAYQPRGGSWSYIGTDCRGIRAGQPTMNLGWATMEASDEVFDSVVIHEFGHALGLLHEHNHPKAKIEWDKPAVIADLSGEPNNWDLDTIERNVFARFKTSNVVMTEFDKVSVMIYAVPRRWTTNGVSCTPSPRLSQGDIKTIQALYA